MATPTEEPSLTGFSAVRAWQRIASEQVLALYHAPTGHGDTVRHQRLLGQLLVDRDDRSGETGVRVESGP